LLREDARHGIADRHGIRLDPHALLQGNVRRLRASGGELRVGARVARAEHRSGSWQVTTEAGKSYSAPVLVNAAGAWADRIAQLAGVAQLGLEPKRRTIITFDAPAGVALDGLPFAKTVGDELYFAPESGRLFASPMDEVPSDPLDAQADEMEVALAAYRMEERTIVKVERIHSRWAGLRTFTPDRHPAAGFAPDAEGFFWLAGQGGFGLQTSPAMARIAASLILGDPWPVGDVTAEQLGPGRFLRQPA
jgi:D-arginine dehydrogenase